MGQTGAIMDEKHIAEIRQTLAQAHHYIGNKPVAVLSPEHQVVAMLLQRLQAAAELLGKEVKKQ
jgi:hypothetical protein